MLTPDDFQYAMETTRVIHEPDRRIETFGATRFEFEILSDVIAHEAVTKREWKLSF